jgi:hypothetical protein
VRPGTVLWNQSQISAWNHSESRQLTLTLSRLLLHPRTPFFSEQKFKSKTNDSPQKNISVPEWPDEWNQTKQDFMTDLFVADGSVQVAKLKTDLQVATSNAELTGVPLQDIVLALLQ